MTQHTPIHWLAHVASAIVGATAVALLVISDLTHVASAGRWGVLMGLVAAVIAATIISDRSLTKVIAASDRRAEVLLTALEATMERHADGVTKTYEDQTEVIAHAVCDAVMDVFDKRRTMSATPIQPRR